MCGILGVTMGNNESQVLEAITAFKYRGPDDTGVWTDDKITFANVRLAIIDPQEKSNQPMFSADNNLGVVFNGEIYNYKEIRNNLHEFEFKTNSDTEVIIYAYKKWGEKCFEKFYGMFAVCIYDKLQNKIILARDYAGIKPLYYYLDSNNNLSFASEMKGLRKLYASTEFEIDTDSISELFCFGYIRSPNTQFKNIKKVQKSTYMIYDLESKNFIEKRYRTDSITNTETNLKKEIEKSLKYHLVSDVPIGLYFSGGIDSSLIASFLNEMKINLKCYSIVMENKDADNNYTNKIAEHLSLDLKQYVFGVTEFNNVYRTVIDHIDEPTLNPAIFATYYLGQQANKEVKVVINGNGGDEYFLGYERDKTLYKLNKYVDNKIDFLDVLYCITPGFPYKRKFFEKVFLLAKKPTSYYLSKISLVANLSVWKSIKLEIRVKNITPTGLEKNFYLENDLLKYSDFSTSICSLEGRVPFVSSNLEYFSIMNNSSLIQNDEPKYYLKKLLEEFLPKEFIYRKKSGFGPPLEKFLESSKEFQEDLKRATLFLENKGIKVSTFTSAYNNKSIKSYIKFMVVSLYKSIS